MKPSEKIENHVKNFQLEINPQKDKKILDELLNAYHCSSRSYSTIWQISKLAAAAVILISLTLWFTLNTINKPKQQNTNVPVVAEIIETPAELMTLSSLHSAFRDSGTEGVEKQFTKAFKLLGPRPSNLSAKDL